MLAAPVGNILMNPAYLRVILAYFLPALLVVGIMLGRIEIMRVIIARTGSRSSAGCG